MRALIRNPGETVTENDGIVGIDWNTGAPLTNPSWAGGSYILVENYDPDICEEVSPDEFAQRAGIEISDTEVEFVMQKRDAGVEHANNPAPETVTIDGKTYTKDELLAILNQTS